MFEDVAEALFKFIFRSNSSITTQSAKLEKACANELILILEYLAINPKHKFLKTNSSID